MLRRGARFGSVAAGAVGVMQTVRFSSKERSDEHTTFSAVQQFLIFDVLRVAGAIARRKHDSDCAHFRETQAALLRERLEGAADTSYGKDRGFAELLRTSAGNDAALVAAFRASHPLTVYEDYAQYVDRVAGGEANVLNAEPETMLAATSGTSGRRALLPHTRQMSSTFFKRGILVLFDTLARDRVGEIPRRGGGSVSDERQLGGGCDGLG